MLCQIAMIGFLPKGSLSSFQEVNEQIYGLPNDRLFSVSDLISNTERFTMRALKGIRKNDMEKLKKNLMIALSFATAVANRFHIDIEEITWKRFPGKCSYCGKAPCVCKKIKPSKRVKIIRESSKKPSTLAEFQAMFNHIYPSDARTLSDVGVHLAEEMGELSEAAHFYLGDHSSQLFKETREELADYVSCFFGVANSADIDVAKTLYEMFDNGCHVCHKAPCVCSFSHIVRFRS